MANAELGEWRPIGQNGADTNAPGPRGDWRWTRRKPDTRADKPGRASSFPAGAVAEIEGAVFVAAFEHAPSGMAFFDPDGTVRHANPSLATILGVPQALIVGTDIGDFVRPEQREELHRWLRSFTRPGIDPPPVRAEGWYSRPDGSRVYAVVEAGLVTSPLDQSRYGLAIIHDQTKDREAEEALEASAHRFEALVGNISDTVTVVDDAAIVKYSAGRSQTVLGYPINQWRGRSVYEVAHPDDRARAAAMIDHMRHHPGVEVTGQYRALHAQGHWERIELTGRNLLDDPDIRGIVLTTRNITEQTRTDALLAAQAHILELIATGGDLDETLGAVLEMVMSGAEGTTASVFVLDEGRVVPHGPRHLPYELLTALGDQPQDGNGLFDLSPDRCEEVVVADVGADRRADTLRDSLVSAGIHSMWSLPVIARAGQHPLGVIAVFHDTPGDPSSHERRAAVLGAQLTAIAIEGHDAQTQLAHRALHDDLTELPNRTLLLDRLNQALARARHIGEEVAVLFLDLDGFKVVNDSLGHSAGDELLVLFAKGLLSIVRPEDTVARFGGDEFVVLCEQAPGATVTLAIAERLEELMTHPFILPDGAEVFLTASMGLAIGDQIESEVLLSNADAAMYRAKDLGRNRLETFDEAMQEAAVSRLAVGNDLRRAIERQEFVLLHQPIFDVDTEQIIGSEALIRWEHPTRGLLLPETFISVSEESELIRPIGQWVLNTALSHARSWCDEHGCTSFKQSVNLSARQLSNPDLVASVADALARHGWPAENLCLELTETVLLDDLDVTLAALMRLKELGVQLAIDDFGTGYSSLTYLQRFPVDSVKIDQSFVSGLGTVTPAEASSEASIARAVVVMAHALGLVAVAEGVETRDQLDVLRGLGCDQAQGFLMSPAVDRDEFSQLLKVQANTGRPHRAN